METYKGYIYTETEAGKTREIRVFPLDEKMNSNAIVIERDAPTDLSFPRPHPVTTFGTMEQDGKPFEYVEAYPKSRWTGREVRDFLKSRYQFNLKYQRTITLSKEKMQHWLDSEEIRNWRMSGSPYIGAREEAETEALKRQADYCRMMTRQTNESK